MTMSDDDQTGRGPSSVPPPSASGDGLSDQPEVAAWNRRIPRRAVLAGAAGVGAIGIGGAIAAAFGGGNATTTVTAPAGGAGTSRPPSSRPSSTRTATRPTTTATTGAPTTAAATTAAPTSTAPPATSSAPPPASTSAPPATSSAPPPPPPTTQPPPPTTSQPTTTQPPPPPPPPGEFLVNAADVPVKGGVIVDTDDYTVVTHPDGPTFCAFTAICTHEGCPVAEVRQNTINCDCHGSQFDAATGEVVSPPAKQPLARKSIVVQDGKVYLV